MSAPLPLPSDPLAPVVGGTNFCAQWTGSLTVPYTGTWQVGTGAIDDGIQILIGSTVVLSNWTDHVASGEFCNGAASTCNQTLQTGVAYPITVNYFNHDLAARSSCRSSVRSTRTVPSPPVSSTRSVVSPTG